MFHLSACTAEWWYYIFRSFLSLSVSFIFCLLFHSFYHIQSNLFNVQSLISSSFVPLNSICSELGAFLCVSFSFIEIGHHVALLYKIAFITIHNCCLSPSLSSILSVYACVRFFFLIVFDSTFLMIDDPSVFGMRIFFSSNLPSW